MEVFYGRDILLLAPLLLLCYACGWDTAAAVSMDDTADSDGFFGLSVYRETDAHGEDPLY